MAHACIHVCQKHSCLAWLWGLHLSELQGWSACVVTRKHLLLARSPEYIIRTCNVIRSPNGHISPHCTITSAHCPTINTATTGTAPQLARPPLQSLASVLIDHSGKIPGPRSPSPSPPTVQPPDLPERLLLADRVHRHHRVHSPGAETAHRRLWSEVGHPGHP